MEWIWLGVILSLILVELVSFNFTSIWFVFSGIISYILLRFEQDYIVQVLAFLIIGMLLILVVRPRIIKKLITKRDIILGKIVSRYTFFNRFIPSDIVIEKNKDKNKDKKNNKSSTKKKKSKGKKRK